VTHSAADEGDDDVLALVQPRERPDPEGRGVVRDEQDGPGHASAAS
jgi:hypothetical protein